MNSLFKMLSSIENNPREVLGNASCQKLVGFLTGWEFATREFICPPEGPNLGQFHSWILSKYGISDALNGLTALEMIAGNDHDAFYLFFKELKNFQEVNPEYFNTSFIYRREGPDFGRRQMLEWISLKPGMYLGAKTVSRLRGFLDGDAYARRQSFQGERLYANLDELEVWLGKQYRSHVTLRCEALAWIYSSRNEALAFDWLIEHIKKFESEHGDIQARLNHE